MSSEEQSSTWSSMISTRHAIDLFMSSDKISRASLNVDFEFTTPNTDILQTKFSACKNQFEFVIQIESDFVPYRIGNIEWFSKSISSEINLGR